MVSKAHSLPFHQDADLKLCGFGIIPRTSRLQCCSAVCSGPSAQLLRIAPFWRNKSRIHEKCPHIKYLHLEDSCYVPSRWYEYIVEIFGKTRTWMSSGFNFINYTNVIISVLLSIITIWISILTWTTFMNKKKGLKWCFSSWSLPMSRKDTIYHFPSV